MKARVLFVASASALALLVSGCGVVSLGGGGLSSGCSEAIGAGSTEFVNTAAELGRQVESGEFSLGDTPNTSVLESALERLEDACANDPGAEAISAFVVQSKDKIDAQTGSEVVRATMYGALAGFCSSTTTSIEEGLSEGATSACAEAERLTNELLAEYSGGAASGATSGSSFDDGFAIDGVDTDLDFPDSSSSSSGGSSTLGSGAVPPYEVTYIVDGVGTAFVTYVTGDDRSESEEVVLPWQYTTTSSYDYTSVSATGDNPGQLSCALYHDGVEVNKSSETADDPFVNCYKFK